MTSPTPPQDLLGDVLPASPRRRGLDLPVLLTGAAALAIAATGTVFAMSLSGGGSQPEDVLPAGAVAFVKLDLDPSASQKLELFELAERFPQAAAELKGADTLREDLLRLAFQDADVDLDYDTDVEPWLGDRFGVVALPSDGAEPGVMAALAVTDEDAARRALEKADAPVEFAFVDGYVLLGETQAAVDAAAAADEHLGDDGGFRDAVGGLGEDQLITAWVDVAKVWDAVPADVREQVTSQPGTEQLDPSGTVVLGLRADDAALELVGRTRDLRTGVEGQDVPVRDGSGLVADLPEQALVALSITGLGEGVTQNWEQIGDALATFDPELDATADEIGIELPEDLAALLGEETAVAVWGSEEEPQFLVRTRTDDPDRAIEAAERAFEGFGGVESGEDVADYVTELGDGIAVGTPEALALAEDGGLGEVEAFRDALPDADDAALALYVDIAGALRAGDVDAPEGVEELRALGLTVSGDGTEFRLRLTFRS